MKFIAVQDVSGENMYISVLDKKKLYIIDEETDDILMELDSNNIHKMLKALDIRDI